jgi:hypothetical protein
MVIASLLDQLTWFMIAVCGAGTALSAAQPPETIMDRMLDGRDAVSRCAAARDDHRGS